MSLPFTSSRHRPPTPASQRHPRTRSQTHRNDRLLLLNSAVHDGGGNSVGRHLGWRGASKSVCWVDGDVALRRDADERGSATLSVKGTLPRGRHGEARWIGRVIELRERTSGHGEALGSKQPKGMVGGRAIKTRPQAGRKDFDLMHGPLAPQPRRDGRRTRRGGRGAALGVPSAQPALLSLGVVPSDPRRLSPFIARPLLLTCTIADSGKSEGGGRH